MQLYAYRNTVASARPKFRAAAEETKVVSLADIKAKREEIFREQKRIADEAIRRANAALRRYHQGVSFEQIVTRICRALKVRPSEVFADRREKQLVLARQGIIYWTCRLSRRSLPEIGRMMGRDHTTVLHGKRVYPQKRARMGRHLREVR